MNVAAVYTIGLSILLLLSGNSYRQETDKIILTCYGYNPCRACTTCNYCKYCNSGGTCGVCVSKKNFKTAIKPAPVKPTVTKPTKQTQYSDQCRAITKKGTRCLRSARSNGYCWQHGG